MSNESDELHEGPGGVGVPPYASGRAHGMTRTGDEALHKLVEAERLPADDIRESADLDPFACPSCGASRMRTELTGAAHQGGGYHVRCLDCGDEWDDPNESHGNREDAVRPVDKTQIVDGAPVDAEQYLRDSYERAVLALAEMRNARDALNDSIRDAREEVETLRRACSVFDKAKRKRGGDL